MKNSTQKDGNSDLRALEKKIYNLTNHIFAAMLVVRKVSEATDKREEQMKSFFISMVKRMTVLEKNMRSICDQLDIKRSRKS